MENITFTATFTSEERLQLLRAIDNRKESLLKMNLRDSKFIEERMKALDTAHVKLVDAIIS